MFVQPIDYFVPAGFCSRWLPLSTSPLTNTATRIPEPVVMKWGFILVTLYMGPLGLLLYVLADKEPRPGEHKLCRLPSGSRVSGPQFIALPAMLPEIILAAAVTATLGLPMWQDLIIEYLSGFAFGLFIFQSLFMRRLMGGSTGRTRGRVSSQNSSA